MAKITNLTVLNPGDKTRMITFASGNGAVAETDDPIVTDVTTFPAASQYTDLTNGKQYVRIATAKAVADWACLNS